MRFIKLAIISFVFFFVLLTLISLFIPSHVRISKAVNIGVPKDQMLRYISDTSTWKNWHPLVLELEKTQKTKNFTASFVSRNDSSIILRTQYATHPTITNGWQVYEFTGADSLTLQWYIDFNLKWYPWQKFGSLFYENTYGVIMQQGLENLRQTPDSVVSK